MPTHKHLFSIDDALVRAASLGELAATKAGLLEMGLFAMPFHRDVYIDVSLDIWVKSADPDSRIILGPFGDGQVARFTLHDRKGQIRDESKPLSFSPVLAEGLRTLLIILLATRNAVKRTTENKLAKLGIGKSSRNRFAYVTTISLPSEMESDPDHPPKGGHMAPHLRRGHVRRQHYGKENSLVKLIWIAPVFVNADSDFVASQRTNYRVRDSHESAPASHALYLRERVSHW